jgi:hypothetical protein
MAPRTPNSFLSRPASIAAGAAGGVLTAGGVIVASRAVGEILAEANKAAADATGINQKEYDFQWKAFPSDVGSPQVGHYMIININVATNLSGESRGTVGNPQVLENEFSKVDVLRFGDTVPSGQRNDSSNRSRDGTPQAPLGSIPRFTRRIKESIALHMPSQVVHTSTNLYDELSLTNIAGKAGVIGASVLAGAVGSIAGAGGVRAAGDLASRVGNAGAAVNKGLGLLKYPINPRIEVIYSNTTLRQYALEVLMAPRNEIESETIREIVRTLRAYAAPEIDPKTYGFTYIPPAEFDITFFHNGVINYNIAQINTCVMERIEVQYDPTGIFSTFSNGHPVAVRLSMAFREVEQLHRRRILEGF